MGIQRLCKDCGKSIVAFNTLTNRCPKCQAKRQKPKKQKPLKQIGKQGEIYSTWLNVVARPYLEKRFGRQCALCKAPPPVNEETGEVGWHHVDHIQKRGSHHDKKMSIHNIRFLCWKCHSEVT